MKNKLSACAVMKSRPNNRIQSGRNWAHSCINHAHQEKLLWENNIKNCMVTGRHIGEYLGKIWSINSSFYSTILWMQSAFYDHHLVHKDMFLFRCYYLHLRKDKADIKSKQICSVVQNWLEKEPELKTETISFQRSFFVSILMNYIPS